MTSAPVGSGETIHTPAFQSILFPSTADCGRDERAEQPPFFTDLNLDRIVDAVTAGRAEYELAPFFYQPLRDIGAVRYRHEVLRDLEKDGVVGSIRRFATGMRIMRDRMAQIEKLSYPYQKERWFLEAVDVYSKTVRSLAKDLVSPEVSSDGLCDLREYVAAYVESEPFTSLMEETRTLQAELAEVKYTVRIDGDRVKVDAFHDEADLSAEVEQTFARFQQGSAKDYRAKLADWPEMNHVEARILDFVALLYPATFAKLDLYYASHQDYLDPAIGRFDREVQFYLAYLEYVTRLRQSGLSFCYPTVSVDSKEVRARDAFDLALAGKLTTEHMPVVCNDFCLTGPERILVVTGPNHGGKTTFARMFGQLHYLASLGLPVPAREAQLFLPDRLFTHFEREEDLATLRGKLEDELVRIHEILQQATSESIVVMNESFSSTTLRDALLIGTAVLRQLISRDVLGVCVTFVDELSSLDQATVSMVGAVVADNPAERTYRIERRPADGLAYAAAIAEKYGLAYDMLKQRVAR